MAVDVVVVGGGVMGSSVAYHLRTVPDPPEVTVVEPDPTYRYASTVLSDGNVRVQFNLEENIAISLHTLDVLATFVDDMATDGYRPEPAPKCQGNLFLVDEDGVAAARRGLDLQLRLGAEVEWLDADDIAAAFEPYRTEGIVGGTLGRRDGSVDPTAVLRGYRTKATELGAVYVEDRVTGLTVDAGRVRGVTLAEGGDVRAEVVVAAAGAWTPGLVATAGVDLPVLPVMRTVYVVEASVETAGLPSVFLPSGLYAITEAGHTWLMGWSQPDDPVGFDFTPAPRERFTDLLWPELVAHLPAFDRLRVEGSWAGLYAVNTFDGNAIVGEWPTRPGLYVVTGFSGHGFQQAPAIGRYVAEAIVGSGHVLDLSRLGPERILRGEPVSEHAGRLI